MILYKNKCYITNSEYPDTDWVGDADFILNDNDEKDAEIEEKIISLYPNFEFVLDDDGDISDVVETSEPINEVISQKKSELSEECEKVIVAGVDVGDAHYSLTIEDQANILAWMAVAQTGKAVPYHSDGNPCVIYSAEDFLKVANAAVAFKTAQTTYCNLLMRQVEAMTDINEVKAVKYGETQLEGEYAEQYQVIMDSLVGKDIPTDGNEISDSTEVSNEVTDETAG